MQSHQNVLLPPIPSLPTHPQVEVLILGLSILSAGGGGRGSEESALAKLPHRAAHWRMCEVASDQENLPLLAAVEQKAEKKG